jgi:hypothetical protein
LNLGGNQIRIKVSHEVFDLKIDGDKEARFCGCSARPNAIRPQITNLVTNLPRKAASRKPTKLSA